MPRTQVKLAILILLLPIIILFSLLNSSRNKDILSPVPSFLDVAKNPEVTTLTLFLPNIRNILSQHGQKPEIAAKAALIYDLTTDTFLYQKNVKSRLPIASLAKIMTAIVALENQKPNDSYIVDDFSARIGENSMGLSSGETLNLEELLYGLVLVSGNDAAETLAANTQGGRGVFIKKINDKVSSLGLLDTVLPNPTGLDDGKTQYSSAYDLLIMTKFVINNFPLFRTVAQTFTIDIPQTKMHKEYFLENQTNLLTSYPGVKGVKTGYTEEAGLCLVTYAENGGHKLIGVILNSPSRREEMRELLDYSFKTLAIKIPGRT